MDEKSSELMALSRLAQELIDKINELNLETGSTILNLAKETKHNKRLIWLVMIGFILDIVLTIALTFSGISISNNSHRIDQVNAKIDEQQTLQRTKGLCPLYKLFIDSENFVPPNQTPEQKKSRDSAFSIIHKSYDALNCKNITG